MRRSSWTGAITAISYGTPHGWDLPEVAKHQLWLGHQLRNSLVEQYIAHQQRMAAIWRCFPTLVQAEEVVRMASANLAATEHQMRSHRMTDRSTRPRDQDKTVLIEQKKVLHAARQALRSEKERHYAAARDAMRQESNIFKQAKRDLYAKYVQQQGLYWATHNDVVTSFDASLRLITKLHQQGRSAQPRFRRWTGEGTITAQLVRAANQPARTPMLLASGTGSWANVCQLSPWVDPQQWESMTRSQQRAVTRVPDHQWCAMEPDQRRALGHGTLLFCIGGKQQIRIPVIIHRMLPAEADVTMVRVTRRLVAGKPKISVSVIARIPAPPVCPQGPAAAVHVGWRSLRRDGVRVGMIASTHRLPEVPQSLRQVVRPLDEHHAEIRIDRGTLQVAGRPAAVRSRRDQMLDDLRQDIIEVANDFPLPAEYDIASIKQWRSPARFVRLLQTWPLQGAPQQLIQRMDAWQRQDRHLWEFECNERQQTAAHIRDVYRNVAVWISSWASLVVTDNWNIREVSRVPGLGEEDTLQVRMARAARQVVAPGSLRALIVEAARARGIAHETVPLENKALMHCACDHGILDRSQFVRHIHVHCSHCGISFDQDSNVTDHLLKEVLVTDSGNER